MAKPKGPMPEESRTAMSQAMIQTKAVRAYLESLQDSAAPRRGRPRRNVEDLRKAIDNMDDPVERLKLRPLLRAALEKNSEDLVAGFIEHCVGFSERHGITYGDWREEGVPAAVLKDAGMSRTK